MLSQGTMLQIWEMPVVPTRSLLKTGLALLFAPYGVFRQHPKRVSTNPSKHRAILNLKIQRDKLHDYQKRIIILTDRETEIAKECLSRNDKKRALLALRRKKYQETLLAKTDAQLAQLEQLTSQVEFALVQKDVLFGLQQGTQVLQAINKEMGGLAAVEKLMGETEEARAYQEVSSRPFLVIVTGITLIRWNIGDQPNASRTNVQSRRRRGRR